MQIHKLTPRKYHRQYFKPTQKHCIYLLLLYVYATNLNGPHFSALKTMNGLQGTHLHIIVKLNN